MCSYSWRVPLTIGTSELSIVSSQELGELGDREGSPTVFQWRWYYHLPSLTLWALVVLPLVLVRENRCLRAWAILIPLMVVLAIFQMTASLFSFSSTNTEFLGTMVASLASGWAIIWLLAHWLSPRRWLLAVVLALIVMLAAGLLSYGCNYGFTDDIVVPLLIFHCVASFSLLLSMALTGRFRRKAHLSASFMVWLLLWTVVSSTLGMLMLMIGLSLFQEVPRIDTDLLLQVLLFGSIGGTALYLLNLPFMLLAFRSRFYRQRFCAVFGLQYARPRVVNDVPVRPHPGQAAEEPQERSEP